VKDLLGITLYITMHTRLRSHK